jgi:ribosomal protein L37AE/L43A
VSYSKNTIDENENKNDKCPHCNKHYTSRSGLWKHIQKCNGELGNGGNGMIVKHENKLEHESEADCESEDEYEYAEKQIQKQNKKREKSNMITPELVMLLIQQNKEMQQMMMEQNKAMIEIAKNAGNNHHNTNNTINDNKSFNLNFFLNETCKNAMNLSDFVNGVDISLDDFEETGRIGYVEGLSRIFCKELRKLDVTERPIHCSDAKRETIYIRENNRWEKDENKEKLLRAVKQIGKKNIKVLSLWQEKYPGYKDVESKENDRYLHILTNIMCGESEEEMLSNYGKIMKNISRITVVNKN